MKLRKHVIATFGNGDCGRLGHGEPFKSLEIPTQVCQSLLGLNMTNVACGGAHTLATCDDGTLFSFGLNDRGQLGHSEGDEFVPVPHEVPIPESVVAVSAGHYHSLCLTSSGNIWAWGANQSGQLGLGYQTAETCEPRIVTHLKDIYVTMITAGASHSMAVSKDGELFTWGEGDSGRLGHGAAKSGVMNWLSQQKEWIPRRVRALETRKIVEIDGGHLHSGCIDSEGMLYMFGSGRHSQLGTGALENASKPTHIHLPGGASKISCGGLHNISVMDDGQILAWGADQNGCLGLGSKGGNAKRIPTKVPGVRGMQCSAGWKHSAVIDSDGNLYSWGWGGSQGMCSWLMKTCITLWQINICCLVLYTP